MSLLLKTRDMSSKLGAAVQGKEEPTGDSWVINEMHEANPACPQAGFVTGMASWGAGLSQFLWLCEAGGTFPQPGDRQDPAPAKGTSLLEWFGSLSCVTRLSDSTSSSAVGREPGE